MIRLLLHIGTEKTGTTTIQHFCTDHRRELLAQGILYPRSLGGPGHKRFAGALLPESLRKDFCPAVDPAGPEDGFRRVPRGGGFFSETSLVRSALRLGTSPSFRSNYLGARLVLEGPEPGGTVVREDSWGTIKQQFIR